MEYKKSFLRVLFTLVIFLLITGQQALAESSWTVEFTGHDNNTNVTTFTITRSEKTYEQTVLYRTVGLSAYAGQHFTATSGSLTFAASETSKTVTVSEASAASNAYWFQSTGTSRSYKLEVTDRAGYTLASCTRNISTGTGTQLSTTYLNTGIVGMTYFEHNGDGSLKAGNMSLGSGSPAIKYLDVAHSGSANTWVKVTDKGYKQAVHTVSTSTLYSSSAQRTFLNSQGTKMYATVYFTQKEEQDGYQYIQILADNASTYDGNDGNGSVNDPSTSLYKACFILSYSPSGSVMTDPHTQFFPHRWDYTDRAAQYSGNSWNWQEFDDDNAHLYAQKFKASSYRAENSGSLVLSTTVSNLNVRFDAAGSDDDNWYFKDLKVRLALVDATAPTKSAVSVAPGRHAKGNTVYVSVAFSEPVTITGSTRKLATNWGDLTYQSGSGTNVLTFSGTIQGSATGTLSITGSDGTIADLAGNNLSGSINADGLCSLDANDLSFLSQDGSGRYLIASTSDLHLLSGYVSEGNNCSGLTFLQTADIAFAHTTDWNSSSSTENNFTAIGKYSNGYEFSGTYDGDGHTISGIRIYRGGTTTGVDNDQGLFGVVWGGIVRNVHLADARITGYTSTGGIVGQNVGIVDNCTVAADVCIHAAQNNSVNHGGIVGDNSRTVQNCISHARLTVQSGGAPACYGGIVGYTLGGSCIITDCIAEGVVIPNVKSRGAIVGLDEYNTATITRNYYRGCKVGSGSVTPSGVGQGIANSTETSDPAGAQPLYAVTLPEHVSLVRTGTNLPVTGYATYDNGADIAGAPYAAASRSIRISYNASIPSGQTVVITAKETTSGAAVAVTDNGNNTYDLIMPAADVTVTASVLPIITYIDADGNPQSHACTPIVDGTFTQYLGAAGCTNWYVVSGEVNTKTLEFKDATTNIILCDGATLSISVSQSLEALCNYKGSINIFAQSGGTGAINVTTACSNGIYANNSIDINGGVITVSNASSSGIWASNGDVTIRRGHINVHGSGHALGARDNVNILGGIVNATGGSGKSGIIAAYATLTLGCSSPTDRIYASSYNAYYNDVRVADGQILSDGTATYSGKLTSDEIAEIAGKTLSTAIPYIDADGTTKYKASKDVTFITSSTSNTINYGNPANTEGWYCVNSDVTFSYDVNFRDQAVHIILCDGATLTCNTIGNYDLIRASNGSLAIYGQTYGTGTLSITGERGGTAIFANTNIDFNGGIIKATSKGDATAIAANGNITIRRGNIIAIARKSYYGIIANTITLGCATTEDRIYANSYSCNGSISVMSGQILTDGTYFYSGTLNNTQIDAIASKTLRLLVPTGVTLATVGEDVTATFDGTSLDTVNIPAPITVKQVTLNRSFTAGKASTVMLPFDYTCTDSEGGTFYRFVGVEQEGNTWVATMQSTANALTANTPYLFMPTGTSITFTIPNEGVTLCTTGGGGGQTADAGSHWTFKGTYAYKEWISNGANSAEIGTVYGFAGVAKDGINVGDFVKVASGAKIRPMSAYLIWSNTANLAPARGGMNAASTSADKLPQSITVRLLDASGTVTNVGEIDMETGEVSFEGWYTLQCVKLDAEPTEPGIYINNGKKVSIK